MSVERKEVGPRMSQIVIHGDTVYLAGVVAHQNAGKSVTAQTREILATIDRYLSEAGTDSTALRRSRASASRASRRARPTWPRAACAAPTAIGRSIPSPRISTSAPAPAAGARRGTTRPRDRLVTARVGRLATVSAAGRPHLVPCCFALEADTIYSAVDAKPKSTLALRRLANIGSTPTVALLVDHYDDDWSALWWVRVDGLARVVRDPVERERALTLLAAKYPQYAATRPPGDVIAISVTTWRAWP